MEAHKEKIIIAIKVVWLASEWHGKLGTNMLYPKRYIGSGHQVEKILKSSKVHLKKFTLQMLSICTCSGVTISYFNAQFVSVKKFVHYKY